MSGLPAPLADWYTISRMQDRDELILSLGPRVRAAVNRIFRQTHSFIDREDMLSEAWIGAIQAVDRFEPERGLTLSTFAEHVIRGHILDYLRRADVAGRKLRQKIKNGTAPELVTIALLDFDLVDERCAAEVRQVEAERDLRTCFKRAKLTRRQGFVLRRKYRDFAPDRELAQELGISRPGVSQLHQRLLLRLRAAL